MAILPGSRIRANGIFGTITDNPLSSVATTFNSVRLADLPSVSGNHAIITLDPLRQFGEPEIIMVTAHTAAATVATVTRNMYGTVARAHPQSTLWVHAATKEDFPLVVTSGTRPTDQYESQWIYETDTDIVKIHNGVQWDDLAIHTSGVWTPYIPTNKNLTVGNGTQSAAYVKNGKMITFRYNLTFGNTTSFTGAPCIGLPSFNAISSNIMPGTAWFLDSSTAHYEAILVVGQDDIGNSVTQAVMVCNDAGGAQIVNATTPFTWTTGDRIGILCTYESI